jgi:hypothetical protein
MGELGAVCGAAQKEQTTADTAVELLRSAAQRANGLASRAEAQLDRIMKPPRPEPGHGNVESVEEEWPPLFSDVREMASQIQCSLRRIEECLDRAGV